MPPFFSVSIHPSIPAFASHYFSHLHSAHMHSNIDARTHIHTYSLCHMSNIIEDQYLSRSLRGPGSRWCVDSSLWASATKVYTLLHKSTLEFSRVNCPYTRRSINDIDGWTRFIYDAASLSLERERPGAIGPDRPNPEQVSIAHNEMTVTIRAGARKYRDSFNTKARLTRVYARLGELGRPFLLNGTMDCRRAKCNTSERVSRR